MTIGTHRSSLAAPYFAGQPCTVFVDVILPLAVPGTFTYALPEDLGKAQPGVRVAVPFGRGGRLYSAMVLRVHFTPPGHGKVRPIVSVLDEAPVVTCIQLTFWETIAAHYLCTLGEVMIAALPAQLALSSQTRIMASMNAEQLAPEPRSALLLQALRNREVLTLEEAGQVLGLKDPLPYVKRLMEKGALQLEERLGEAWKPRMLSYVRLTLAATAEDALHEWFDRLEKRSPKQLHVLMRYIELSRCLGNDPREVQRSRLAHVSGGGMSAIKQLVEKGVFELYEREEGLPPHDAPLRPLPTLSEAQQAALEGIRTGCQAKGTVLLRGVTSSGKTEVYITLIEEALREGGQVLYMLPEIALTTQMIGRLRERFGERIAISHSRMSQHDRMALWMRMAHDQQAPSIVIGARSAVFLPFRHLALVVVDEEHDPSYKQHDPAPRYHARDMAVVLAQLHGAKVVLGSATPSMESLHNAHSGKYGLVELLIRYGAVAMPTVTRVDLRDSQRRKLMRGHFSRTLIDAIQQALDRKEQAILFQNRRGYVPVWQCENCSWVPNCDHCDVSLTYHKHEHRLRCHYCSRHYQPPTTCAQCGGTRLRMLGFGTEKIEEELGELFPSARIARMDQDTTRGVRSVDRLLTSFGQGALDILVGTQMVTKGLDFEHVSVVGIMNADKLLRFPDLRAHERAFQLMAQVAGRSGRRSTPGTVIIQAMDTNHPVLDLVVRHDVEGFYKRELEHRRAHGYPPFTRLIEITLKHRYEDRVSASAGTLAMALREGLGDRVLGPDIPVVSRIRDRHLRKLLVKLRRSAHMAEKHYVRDTIDRVFALPEQASVQLVMDVDPL